MQAQSKVLERLYNNILDSVIVVAAFLLHISHNQVYPVVFDIANIYYIILFWPGLAKQPYKARRFLPPYLFVLRQE